MDHNPDKNRALCVLAKTSVSGLRGLLALTLSLIGGIFVFGFVLKIFADWNWAEAGKAGLAVLVLLAFLGFVSGIVWLVLTWYEWAKRYARDC